MSSSAVHNPIQVPTTTQAGDSPGFDDPPSGNAVYRPCERRKGVRKYSGIWMKRSGRNDQLLVQHTPRDSPGLRDACVRQCLCIVNAEGRACGKFDGLRLVERHQYIYADPHNARACNAPRVVQVAACPSNIRLRGGGGGSSPLSVRQSPQTIYPTISKYDLEASHCLEMSQFYIHYLIAYLHATKTKM